MQIYLAADHRGFRLKELLKSHSPQIIDIGATSFQPEDDYPDYANLVCDKLQPDDLAILICGSGHGMDIAANRHPHVRAILGFNLEVVKQGRADENANVLILPADWVSDEQALQSVDLFLKTPFTNDPRHLRRLSKLKSL